MRFVTAETPLWRMEFDWVLLGIWPGGRARVWKDKYDGLWRSEAFQP